MKTAIKIGQLNKMNKVSNVKVSNNNGAMVLLSQFEFTISYTTSHLRRKLK